MSRMSLQRRVERAFAQWAGDAPAAVARAPGRVNLIGEHTDYNDGFVLPMTIDRAVWIAFRPRDDGRVHVHSLDFDAMARFPLDDLQKASASAANPNDHWAEYVKGVAWALREAGHRLRGWEGVVAGDVPLGAGLSSSAALEMATARVFAAVSGLTWDASGMARIGQRAENDWIGVNCGVMDQMISAAGRAGHALLIDCRSLETRPAPIPPDAVVVVLDTSTRRGLADSAYNAAYNERRIQCEAAAQFFGVPALRDVSVETFEARADGLNPVTRRRARHVVMENARVLTAVEALHAGDARRLGRLMDASHASLCDDFEVSSPELDHMAACARRAGGCYGARMTGAGFGGCAVALVQKNAVVVGDFVAAAETCYRAATGLSPHIYVCTATNGAALVEV